MKAVLLIAALMGTAAVAQTTPDAAAPATTDANAPAVAAPDAMPAPAAPAADATANVAGNAQAVATDTSNYPVCSRSVTDKCVQRGAAHKAHRNH